jgi:DNA-binding SARP family transcriptional activator
MGGDTTRAVDFGVLGPFEVRIGGAPREVGGPRLRTLLAVLAAEAGRVVSVPALGRALWGERPPEHADRTVRTYLSRLRGTVDPDLITTRSPGYVLHVAPRQLDAARFEELAAGGRRALAAGEPGVARGHLTAAWTCGAGTRTRSSTAWKSCGRKGCGWTGCATTPFRTGSTPTSPAGRPPG